MPGLGYTNPNQMPPMPSEGGGNWLWDAAKGAWNFLSDNAGSVLGAVGNGVDAYMSSADRARALAEQKDEFGKTLAQRQAEAAAAAAQDAAHQAQAQKQFEATQGQQGSQFNRTTGDAEGQQAALAQTALNKLPLADKAQALLLARMGHPPTTFAPRDYTKGLTQLNNPATGGPADALAAARTAAANYVPGQGGVDSSTLKLLIAKLRGSSGLTAGSTGGTPTPWKPSPTPRIFPKVTPTLNTPPIWATGTPPTMPTPATPAFPKLPSVPTAPSTTATQQQPPAWKPEVSAPIVPPSGSDTTDPDDDPNSPAAALRRRMILTG